jgi:ATP-dependent DNA helicase RecQ
MLPPELKPEVKQESRQPRRRLFPPDGATPESMADADVPSVSETDAPDIASFDEALFLKLRDLRTQFARKIHVPPYIIFSDAALRDMCRKQPLTREAFLAVSGVGEVKLEKYGAAFMEVIREHNG